MRGAFITALAQLARRDERIVLLTGDLGYLAIEPFQQEFPHRFYNMGVAEQNMVGVATGLAEAGFIPFVYSIVTFAALRPYEFIRNGPIQHRLPVRIVGVGGGVEYGTNGLSHYGLEDIAVMRAQPGITVIAPADYRQTREALNATWDLQGPVYYRLGKDDKSEVPDLDGRFSLDGLQVIGDGGQALVVSMGGISREAAKGVQVLRDHGIACTHAILSTVSPVPGKALSALLREFPVAVSMEAHNISGGVGSLVAEVIAEGGIPCRLIRLAVRELPGGISGSQEFLYQRHGISAQSLAEAVAGALRGQL